MCPSRMSSVFSSSHKLSALVSPPELVISVSCLDVSLCITRDLSQKGYHNTVRTRHLGCHQLIYIKKCIIVPIFFSLTNYSSWSNKQWQDSPSSHNKRRFTRVVSFSYLEIEDSKLEFARSHDASNTCGWWWHLGRLEHICICPSLE